jgi:hypothetical protein
MGQINTMVQRIMSTIRHIPRKIDNNRLGQLRRGRRQKILPAAS